MLAYITNPLSFILCHSHFHFQREKKKIENPPTQSKKAKKTVQEMGEANVQTQNIADIPQPTPHTHGSPHHCKLANNLRSSKPTSGGVAAPHPLRLFLSSQQAPPLPPRFRRSVSDMSCLSTEESATPDSVRLRRFKERLKEMRQCWDEVMKDDDAGEQECALAQDDKDDLGDGDSEEAVSVEWAEQCIRLVFGCPCGKGYEILLSENNCYYKLI
ncbi:hypothetical protein Fmac_022500 [Flemingia macrophylla]|uniref:Uncharacterized protein n=1 Tax=Flemingia macrophylla TaxID=520843 RepID=A0ABD1M0G9_9FABA